MRFLRGLRGGIFKQEKKNISFKLLQKNLVKCFMEISKLFIVLNSYKFYSLRMWVRALYKIDRMLAQLDNAKVFNKIKGFIFGKCTNCIMDANQLGTFTLYKIIKKHTQPHRIPSFMGSTIGHEPKNFTLPIGVIATFNADIGSIKLLHQAVR